MTDVEATPVSTTPDAKIEAGGAAATHPKTDAPSAASPQDAKKAAAAAKRAAKKVSAESTKKPAAKKSSTSTTKKSGSAKNETETASAKVPEARSAAEIQADINAAQARLAEHVDELSDRLNPQHLAEEAVSTVKRVFLNEDGSPKGKPIAITAGSVTALLLLRKIFHRG